MNKKFRYRCLVKLAQTNVVSGSPPAFQLQGLFPTIYVGYNQNTAQYIIQLTNYLNIVLYYSSGGKIDFPQLFNNISSIGTTGIIDQELKKLIDFTKIVIQQLLNNKVYFQKPLNSDEIKQRLSVLNAHPSLNMLSDTNPTGQLSIKSQGNIKTNLRNYLLNIFNSISLPLAQPTR